VGPVASGESAANHADLQLPTDEERTILEKGADGEGYDDYLYNSILRLSLVLTSTEDI